MKVLFISNLYPPVSVGGYEQICCDVAEGLRQRGHTVSILCSDFGAQDVRGVENNVARLLKVDAPPGIVQTVRSYGVTRTRVELEWYNSRILRRMLAHVRPEIVLVWNAARLGGGLLSVAEQHGIVVYYLSDAWLGPLLAIQGKRHWTLLARARRLYRRALRTVGIPDMPVRTDHLIFCSHALQAQYAEMGAEVSRGAVIHHGVSGPFSMRAQHILQRTLGECFRLLYVGQITPQKGVATLVAALSALRALPGLENTRLTLVGPTTNEIFLAQLKASICDFGLVGAVEFKAARPRAELPVIYEGHDVLAFPSEWSEPFSLTLLEGMATGIPVVATQCGGSAEIVQNGQNALAFTPGDAVDLARKLAWMLVHPNEAAAIGATASAEVRCRHTLGTEVEAIETYLRGALPCTA